jgi:DnaK suppressor protein
MSRDKFVYFRDILLEMRRDMASRVQDIENRWRETSEPAIEVEEEAQRATMTLPYDRLDESGRRTIEQIDIAVNNILTGDFGICENCEDEISLKRLEAVPWTRLCIDCAGDLERKPKVVESAEKSFETSESSKLPGEYQGLSNDQILTIVHEQIEKNGRIDTEDLDISLRHGVLYLEGTIAGGPEHQILLKLLGDVLGFSAILDHLVVDEAMFERADRAPGKSDPAAGPAIEDSLFNDARALTGDLVDAGDEKPYNPPEITLPRDYGRKRGRPRTERSV